MLTEFLIVEEIQILQQFIASNSSKYIFTDKESQDLFTYNIEKRFYDKEWRMAANPNLYLKVLQLVRLMTRDKNIVVYFYRITSEKLHFIVGESRLEEVY